eukprot:gnl/TRDRNA2_/TRDRNA2_81208_c0_seq2.p2 gnl/TRDRNA2_/TRDRNA2_81208_c0~~gnl/TRDRNA2_/TRDRNA2_81208_c0_seq2.p2  ORF type:complete len:215 (-),score=48.51 gnl/TRDRNA2_/TRDRNA2_81208_c0_seq2:220-864(-)
MNENRQKEGVLLGQQGLQFKVLKKGKGVYKPWPECEVEFSWAGTTPTLTPDAPNKPLSEWKRIDGNAELTETVSRADKVAYEGFKMLLLMMMEGDELEAYIPAPLAMGDESNEEVGLNAGDVWIVRITMHRILAPEKTTRGPQCNIQTKESCLDTELDLIAEYAKKPADDAWDRVMELKAESDATYDDRKQAYLSDEAGLMKSIAKARQKGVEL